MDLKSLSPFSKTEISISEDKIIEAVPAIVKNKASLFKLFKSTSRAIGVNSNYLGLDRANFEEPPWDLETILQAADTDSYVNQAFGKYQQLIWKSGWEVVGENPEAVNYVKKRIAFMEVIMDRPFHDLLSEISDQYTKFHNVYIVKARADVGQYLPGNEKSKDPIMGYYVLPTEMIRIKRNKHNKTLKYKQVLDETTYGGNDLGKEPSWNPEEVIHLFKDRKIGRPYGTPFIISALDDVIALRQIEQDLQNLIHRELMPFYKYYIEDSDHEDPDPDLVEQIAEQMDALRVEGSVVLPPGHNVDVLGAEGKALDIEYPLAHFKERVALGLGVFPHHLGMVSFAGANRDMTDKLDQLLYEKVKLYQRELSKYIQFYIFNELLEEGGFNPYGLLTDRVSDSIEFRFKEIDMDSLIKKENHIINKAAQGVTSVGEARQDIDMDPILDEDNTIAAMHERITANYNPSPPTASTSPVPAKKTNKGSQNRVTPKNQHGTRTSPNVRMNAEPESIEETLDNKREVLVKYYLGEKNEKHSNSSITS